MPGYTYVWEFHVAPDWHTEFELAYGPDGDWVKLFHEAPGYIGSSLLKDRANPLYYVTVDRWANEAAYRAFREQNTQKYDDLDRRCQRYTTSERLLGELVE